MVQCSLQNIQVECFDHKFGLNFLESEICYKVMISVVEETSLKFGRCTNMTVSILNTARKV